MCQLCHESPWAGHPGQEKTAALVRRYGYWPRIDATVRDYIQQCEPCNRRNTPAGLSAPLQQPYLPTRPGELIGVDMVGPLPSDHGHNHLLTVVDHYTKYAEAYPLADTGTKAICDILLQEYIPRHGIPERILSDRGPNFTSQLVKSLCRTLGISKLQTTAYHPQGNGVVERFHRTLADIIAKLSRKGGRDWEAWLPAALASYRSLPHCSTGYSPNYLTYGRELYTQIPDLPPTEADSEFRLRMRLLRKAQTVARETIGHMWKKREKQVNQRRTPRNFHAGQGVFLRQMQPPPGIPKKYHCPWLGPFRIEKKLSEVTYVVRDTVGKDHVVHINRLKPAFGQQQAEDGPRPNLQMLEPPQPAEAPPASTMERPSPQEDWYECPGDPTPQPLQCEPAYRLRPKEPINYRRLHCGK